MKELLNVLSVNSIKNKFLNAPITTVLELEKEGVLKRYNHVDSFDNAKYEEEREAGEGTDSYSELQITVFYKKLRQLYPFDFSKAEKEEIEKENQIIASYSFSNLLKFIETNFEKKDTENLYNKNGLSIWEKPNKKQFLRILGDQLVYSAWTYLGFDIDGFENFYISIDKLDGINKEIFEELKNEKFEKDRKIETIKKDLPLKKFRAGSKGQFIFNLEKIDIEITNIKINVFDNNDKFLSTAKIKFISDAGYCLIFTKEETKLFSDNSGIKTSKEIALQIQNSLEIKNLLAEYENLIK